MGCCCCMALFPLIERFSSNKCVLHEITLLSWVLGWWLTSFSSQGHYGATCVLLLLEKEKEKEKDVFLLWYRGRSLQPPCPAWCWAACQLLAQLLGDLGPPSGGPVSLSSLFLDLRQGSSVPVFLGVVFRRWDGNSDVLGCDGNSSSFEWAVSWNWWVVSPLPKICNSLSSDALILSSRPTVNRYICSSLFCFLLQFVIHKIDFSSFFFLQILSLN